MLQHLVCRVLLRILLGGALGSAHELSLTVIADRLQSNFDRESLTVLGSQLFYQHVRCLRTAGGLEFFLQS